jgi:signal transduction histidine kinase
MDRLIKAILKLSRDGRRVLTPESLDMTAQLRAVAESLNHQAGEVGASFEVETLPGIVSDRLALEQVFGNLLDNALKYLDPKRPGRIVVRGREDGPFVVYEIEDNGRGVAPRDHERIFELFRRAGTQDRPGEGLGLAFVKNAVRRLGGSIDLESELGKGSTFTLKFPKRLTAEASESGDVE